MFCYLLTTQKVSIIDVENAGMKFISIRIAEILRKFQWGSEKTHTECYLFRKLHLRISELQKFRFRSYIKDILPKSKMNIH